MPLDPSIVQGLQPIGIAPPDNSARMNQLALLMKMQGLQSENQLNQLKLSGAQQSMDAQNRLRGLDLTTEQGRREALLLGEPGVNAVKAWGESQTGELDRQTKKAAIIDAKLKRLGQIAAQADSPEMLMRVQEAVLNDPDTGALMGQIANPDIFRAHLNASIFMPDPTGAVNADGTPKLVVNPEGFKQRKMAMSGMSFKEMQDVLRQQREVAVSEKNAATSAGQLGLEREKFADDKANPTLSFQDTAAGPGAFNPRTGALTPLEVGGKPIPPKTGAEALPQLGKLLKLRDSLPPDSPDLPVVEKAIQNETQSNAGKLDERTKAKFEQAYPKASASVKAFNTETDDMLNVIKTLATHPGTGRITGGFAGVNAYAPNITEDARNAQALYDRLLGMGQFKALTDLRQNSPTGAGVGNVSDFEGRTLRDSFAALQRTQGTEAFKSELANLATRLKASKENVNAAFDDTYAYRNESGASAGGPAIGTVINGHRFKGGNPNDPANWEKAP